MSIATMAPAGLNRRAATFLLLAALLAVALFVNALRPASPSVDQRLSHGASRSALASDSPLDAPVPQRPIAPKLSNETLKADLGRAAWKLFHTTLARFPQKPKADESAALKSYIHLFARLYPCGECAGHFVKILDKFPPQVSNRNAAMGWGCHVHNEVNKSLGKGLFDCSRVDEEYDCGCGDDEVEEEGDMSDKAASGENEKKRDRESSTVDAGSTRPYLIAPDEMELVTLVQEE